MRAVLAEPAVWQSLAVAVGATILFGFDVIQKEKRRHKSGKPPYDGLGNAGHRFGIGGEPTNRNTGNESCRGPDRKDRSREGEPEKPIEGIGKAERESADPADGREQGRDPDFHAHILTSDPHESTRTSPEAV